MNMGELHSHGMETTGKQMASYLTDPLLSVQGLISLVGTGQWLLIRKCWDTSQCGPQGERQHAGSSWLGPSLRLGFYIPAGIAGGKPMITTMTEPRIECFIHQQKCICVFWSSKECSAFLHTDEAPPPLSHTTYSPPLPSRREGQDVHSALDLEILETEWEPKLRPSTSPPTWWPSICCRPNGRLASPALHQTLSPFKSC